jgi:uncharacterized protein YegJ (DUF2314 family)
MNRNMLITQICFAPCLAGASSVAEDHVQDVASDDGEMLAAINKARGFIREFFDAFTNPKPGQESFLLKVAFTEDGQVEHLWIADLDVSGAKPKGVVASEPRLKKLRFKQTVEFDPAYISDWMYVDHGKLIGGYTTRLLRERMTTEGRKRFDSSVPYTF